MGDVLAAPTLFPALGIPVNEFRIARHPFTLIGYTNATGETKTATPTEFALYASEIKPALFAIVRIADGRISYRVRGQCYASIHAARKVA